MSANFAKAGLTRESGLKKRETRAVNASKFEAMTSKIIWRFTVSLVFYEIHEMSLKLPPSHFLNDSNSFIIRK